MLKKIFLTGRWGSPKVKRYLRIIPLMALLNGGFHQAIAGSTKLNSRNIKLKLCADQGDCAFEFWTRGSLTKMGEKDYFKFYNNRAGLDIDPVTTSPPSSGSLLQRKGVKVVAYKAKRKGRRNCPKSNRDIRKIVGGTVTFLNQSLENPFDGATLPKGRWIVLCLEAKKRGQSGNYNIRYELERPDSH